MELRVLNSGTLTQSPRETNNDHTAKISSLNFNLKLWHLVQFTDKNKDCVFNDKWSAVKMTSFYKRLQDVQKERAISFLLCSPLSTLLFM